MKLPPQLISTSGSERATNDSGKIVVHNGRAHVVWQDVTREGYFNRVRTRDDASGVWSEPTTLDQGVDNHARGVMTVDPEGYLHVVLGGHGSAVSWCCSLRPGDSSAWTETREIGVGTYPILQCAADGTLYLTLRGQGGERHLRGVDFYRRRRHGEWEAPRRIVRLAKKYGQAYAGFPMQMAIAGDGTIHGIFEFYEGADDRSRGLHQAICYARSRDGGENWEKADGTAAVLPARPGDFDILARNTLPRHEKLPPSEIKHGGIVVDSGGKPFFFYLHHTKAPGLLIAGTIDGDGGIRERAVSHHWEALWPRMRAIGCWSTIREDDAIHALVQLTPFDNEWIDGKPTRAINMDERSDQRLVWLISADGGRRWEVRPFLEPGSVCNCPSLEQSTGANLIPAGRRPAVLYFDGSSGYPGGGDYYADGLSVAEILASGGFRANNVWLARGAGVCV